jgi:hypothetical protein
LDLTVTLTDEQLEAIAHRVAELLADQLPFEPASELLTAAQAAGIAGVSAKTIRNWLSAGPIDSPGQDALRPGGGGCGTADAPGTAETPHVTARTDAETRQQPG